MVVFALSRHVHGWSLEQKESRGGDGSAIGLCESHSSTSEWF